MCQNTASSFLSVSGQTRSSRFQLSSGAFSCRVSQISELRAGAEPPQNEALCFCDAQQTSPYPSASFCCSLPFQHLHKTAGPSAVRLPALLLVPPGVSPVWPGQSRRIGACRRCFSHLSPFSFEDVSCLCPPPSSQPVEADRAGLGVLGRERACAGGSRCPGQAVTAKVTGNSQKRKGSPLVALHLAPLIAKLLRKKEAGKGVVVTPLQM